MTPAEKETRYLLAIPGMGESIRKGMSASPEECSDRLWEGMGSVGSGQESDEEPRTLQQEADHQEG